MTAKAAAAGRARGLTARQRAELREAMRIYRPPATGIHVCGSDDLANAAVTLAAFPMAEEEARAAFARVRAEFGEPGGDGDAVVDLFVRGDVEEDFMVRRQMLARMSEALR